MKIAIMGATSAIAQETAKCFARDGAEMFLVARSAGKLTAVAEDLKVRGARRVETHLLDLSNLEQHQEMFDRAVRDLGNQRKCESSVEETMKELSNNFTSFISLLTISANYFAQQKHGCIAVISSVAGDRGRQSNYIYGTAKGAITIFLQGLRNRLAQSGVNVLTVKPGFVATPMTASLKKGLLFAKPEVVGRGIYQAMKQGKDIVYLPWYWYQIMLVIRSIPERIFKRLSL
jgi:short-subunit dehydrogenase